MDKTPNILIKEALQQAVAEINNGVSPTEALKKSAEYHDLNYEFIQRTGEALNTALHYNHFKTAADQAADFPIADIKGVINFLYNENEKTANHFNTEAFPSSDLFNPIPDLDKIFNRPQYKEAYLKIASAPKDVKPDLTPKRVLEKASNYIREMEKQLTNVQIKESEATLNIDASFFNLADGFRRDIGGRTPFEEFESQSYAKYAEEAIPYLDLIYKHANLKEERGVHDAGYVIFDECPELKKLSKFFGYVKEVETVKKEAADAKENLQYEKDYIDEIYKSAANLKKKSEVVFEPTELDKTAAGFADLFKHVQDQVKNEQKKSPGPSSDRAMDLFEQQAVLQNLIISDPILSKEDPHKVIQAFTQVARLAPDVAKELDVCRAILRSMVSGQALAPHSSNQLVEANLNMLKLKGLQSGQPQHNK